MKNRVKVILAGIAAAISLSAAYHITVINGLKKICASAMETTIDTVLDELKHTKILAIGEDHRRINEFNFIAKNIQALYGAGVRFLFLESGLTIDESVLNNKNYHFLMFYPWLSAGRDASAAETIITIMDNADDAAKAVIHYGAGHTYIGIWKNFNNSDSPLVYDWMTLGYRLKKYYGGDFASYLFVTGNNYKDITREFNLLKLFKGFHYDGFIAESELLQGSFYQYHPADENLKFIFNTVEDYALNNRNTIPDADYLIFDPQDQFLIGLYYLKLYFGGQFNYDFWRTGTSKELLTALHELKDYAFNDAVPSKFIKVNYDGDAIRLYHTYMDKSEIEAFIYKKNSIQEDYLLKAYGLFPEDIWSLYWLGFAAAEKKQYTEALDYFQLLFENDLASCMESLPSAYRKAAFCAGKLKNKKLEAEYTATAESLYNEYDINVDGYYYTGYFK